MYSILKIFCTAGLVLLASFVFAQHSVLDKKIDCAFKGKSLVSLLDYLDEEHQIKFSYATESVKNIPINSNYSNQSLGTILTDVLSTANIDFRMYDEVVMLRKSKTYEELEASENYKNSLHLKGRITDKLSSENLEAATISISGTTVGTYTDEDGSFDMEISEKYLDHQLIIQYLGYEQQKFEITQLDDSFLLIPLSVSDIGIDEIVIVNRDIPIKIGDGQSYSMSRKMINNQTTSAAGSDPIKNIQLLPGISAFDDTSSDIKIRGSNSDETLVVLDGIPLYNLDHYYGIFSNVNSNYIEEINIYKNDIPVNFSEKTAGVVEMKSKIEYQSDPSAIVDLNLLTASVNLTLPVTSNSMLLFGGRSSYKDVTNTSFNSVAPMREVIRSQNFTAESILNSSDPSFKFRDVNAKFIWNPKPATKLMFNFFNSEDNFENEFENINGNPDDRVKAETESEEDWKNLGAGLQIETALGNNILLSSNLYYSSYESESSLKFTINRSPKGRREEMQRLGSSRENQISDIGANLTIEKKLNKGSLTTGISASLVDANFDFMTNGQTLLSGEGEVGTFSSFAAFKYKPVDNLTFNFSAKGSYYTGTEKFYFSPRVSSTYRINDNFSIKGAYGIYQQFIREFKYENSEQSYSLWVHADKDNRIPEIVSRNAMLGFTYKNNRVSFDAELYHKDIDGMIEFAIANPRDNEFNLMMPRAYILQSGIGYSKGIDLLLGYNHKHVDTYLAYTLSKVEQSFRQIDGGTYYPSEDDRRHQLKWINQLHFGKFSLNANWVYNTGLWYTDLKAFEKNEETRNKDPKFRFKKLDPYSRIDVGVNYRLQFNKTKIDVGASVFNLLNNENVKFQQTVESKFEEDQRPVNTFHSTETALLAKTFNLNLKFYFN